MKGIEILGEAGQEIRSVAKGKVIYAGEDLKGYGRLVIIKHEDNLITVYGHTQEILVREGQSVEAAEAIATMGNSGTEQFKLLFEVRKGGQSVDPLRYLKQSS
jgi:lipoprotein NlpD